MLPLRLYRRDCETADGVNPCSTCAARSLSVCASLSGDGIARLAEASTVVSVPAGGALVRQGDEAREVINITAGSARVVRQLEDGRRQVVGFVFAGDVFGTTAGDIQDYSVEALEPVTACRFRKSQHRALAREHPELEGALLDRLGDELRDAQDRMVTLGRLNAAERVAACLLELEARLGARSDGRLTLPMTRADLADYLGLTIETVSRVMNDLKASGSLALESPRRLRLTDRRALEALAGR